MIDKDTGVKKLKDIKSLTGNFYFNPVYKPYKNA